MSLVQLPLNINIIGASVNNSTTSVGLHSDARLGVHSIPVKDDRLASPPLPNRYNSTSNSSSDDSPKNHISLNDLDRLSMIDVGRKTTTMITNDDLSDARSSSVSSYQADSYNNRGSGCDPDDEDRMSCCSDDSELSVGKEVDENERKKLCDDADDSEDDDDDDDDIQDGSCTPATERTMICGSEADISNESSRFHNHLSGTSPIRNDQSPAVRFPIIRPSPTRLQEEFLRNSQLYAEELMKHQMNFMAATKVLNISPKLNEHTFGFPVRPSLSVDELNPLKLDEQKIGFRPHIRLPDVKDSKWSTIDDRCSKSPDGMNFRGIHSHLNAISRITSALGRDMVGIASLTSPGSMTSRENSESPPNNLHQMINNNIINDSNLKFSIDNILKPGFGRRITDPLLKRNKSNKKSAAAQRASAAAAAAAAAAIAAQLSMSPSSMSSSSPPEKHVTPIDLTATTNCGMSSSATNTATTTTTPSTSSLNESPQSPQSANESTDNGSTTTTGGNKSNSPMVWPAWVYCTRYSDRPSSGKFNATFFFFFISYYYYFENK